MQKIKQLQNVARLSFGVSLVLLLVKFFAYYLTGSKAILSDALESIINVITAAFLIGVVHVSTQPVDEDHPYGHGKAESFSAGVEGGLIVLAAIMILIEAVPDFFMPRPPQNLGTGIVLLAGAGCVNLLVGLYLIHSGKKLKSEAVRADGQHIMTDFYTSAGVVIGLLLVRLTDLYILDPLIACLVAVNILVPGIRLVRASVKNLMNEADPELLARIVQSLNAIKKPGWLHPHKLRALRSGRYHHVDMHIMLPHYWPLDKVHATQKEITDSLLDALGEEGDIMIHIDPCEPAYCHHCDLNPCAARKMEPCREDQEWTVQQVVAPRKPLPDQGELQ